MNKIKEFLCYTNPENLAFGTLIVVLLVGYWIFAGNVAMLILLISLVGTAVVIFLALGLTKLIKKAQEKCKENEDV